VEAPRLIILEKSNKQPRFRYWPKADKARATTSIGWLMHFTDIWKTGEIRFWQLTDIPLAAERQ
jgi:hypothetical protein